MDSVDCGGVGLEADHSRPSTANSNVQVAVRVRPPNDREREQGYSKCLGVDRSSSCVLLAVKPNPVPRRFFFDHVADEETSQLEIFLSVGKPIADSCLQGYHCCLLAYGQTGAGKTFTMEGPDDGDENETSSGSCSSDNRGMVPRILDYMFERMELEKETTAVEYTVRCSYLQIYNEQVSDLLDPDSANLNIREDIKRGTYVDGIQEVMVSTPEAAAAVRRRGSAHRKVGMTAMNQESSRSHSVFTLVLESQRRDETGVMNRRISRFYLVDLAGSERQRQSEAAGQRLKEAGAINKSLSALGNVIKALVDISEGKIRHVPYRDSKLTFLLRDALGGNAKCSLVAAVSPAEKNAEETLSTLKFMERAKLMRNAAVVNEDMLGNPAVMGEEIRRLRMEIASLRAMSRTASGPYGYLAPSPLAIMPSAEPSEPETERVRRLNHIIAESTKQTLSSERRTAKEMAELRHKLEASEEIRQRLEFKVQSMTMFLKLKEAALASVKEDATGRLISAIPDGEKHRLEEEISALRKMVDNHPELVRFRMELELYKSQLDEAREALAAAGTGTPRFRYPGDGDTDSVASASTAAEDEEKTSLIILSNNLRAELAEQQEDMVKALEEAEVAKKEAEDLRRTFASLEDHVRRIAKQAEDYRVEVNTTRQLQWEKEKEMDQASHMRTLAEAKVSELTEQLALEKTEKTGLISRIDEQGKLQLDLLSELEKVAAEKEELQEKVKALEEDVTALRNKREDQEKVETELLQELEKATVTAESQSQQLSEAGTALGSARAEAEALKNKLAEVENEVAEAQTLFEAEKAKLQGGLQQMEERLRMAKEDADSALRQQAECYEAQLRGAEVTYSKIKKDLEEKMQLLADSASSLKQDLEDVRQAHTLLVEATKAQDHEHQEALSAVERDRDEKLKSMSTAMGELENQVAALVLEKEKNEMALDKEQGLRLAAEAKADQEAAAHKVTAEAKQSSEANLAQAMLELVEAQGLVEQQAREVQKLIREVEDESRKREAEVAAERKRAAQEIESVRNELDKASAAAAAHAKSLEEAVALAMGRLDEAQIEMEKLKEGKEAAETEKSTALQRAASLQNELDQVQLYKQKIEGQMAELQIKMIQLETSKQEAESGIGSLRAELETALSRKAAAEAEVKRLQEEVAGIQQNAAAEAAARERELTDAMEKLQGEESARRSAEEEAAAAKAAEAAVRGALRQAEQKLVQVLHAFNSLERRATALELLVVNMSEKAAHWQQEAKNSDLLAHEAGQKGGIAEVKLVLSQLSVVEATAECRLCTALCALSAQRAQEKAARRQQSGGDGAPTPWKVTSIAEEELSSEETDSLEKILVDIKSAKAELLQSWRQTEIGSSVGRNSALPLDASRGTLTQSLPAGFSHVPWAQFLDHASEGGEGNLAGCSLDVAKAVLERGLNTLSEHQKQESTSDSQSLTQRRISAGGQLEGLAAPGDGGGNQRMVNTDDGVQQCIIIDQGRRWTVQEEMQAVSLELLRGLHCCRTMMDRMEAAVDELEAQLEEEEAQSASRQEVVEDIKRLREAAERQKEELASQVRQQQEEVVFVRSQLHRAEGQLTDVQARVSKMEAEQEESALRERETADSVQVVLVQRDELERCVKDLRKSLASEEEQKQYLLKQLDAEGQRLVRVQEKLRESERRANVQKQRLTADFRAEADALEGRLQAKTRDLEETERQLQEALVEMDGLKQHKAEEQQQSAQRSPGNKLSSMFLGNGSTPTTLQKVGRSLWNLKNSEDVSEKTPLRPSLLVYESAMTSPPQGDGTYLTPASQVSLASGGVQTGSARGVKGSGSAVIKPNWNGVTTPTLTSVAAGVTGVAGVLTRSRKKRLMEGGYAQLQRDDGNGPILEGDETSEVSATDSEIEERRLLRTDSQSHHDLESGGFAAGSGSTRKREALRSLVPAGFHSTNLRPEDSTPRRFGRKRTSKALGSAEDGGSEMRANHLLTEHR